MSRALLLHHSFGPYHAARVEVFRRAFKGTLQLAELASSEALREWRRPGQLEIRTAVEGVLEGLADKKVAAGVRALLDDARPDVVVIAGYAHAGMREAARWARSHRRPAILISDSHHSDKVRFAMKEAAKKLWVKTHFAAAFTSGAAGADYVASLGISPERIWRGYDVVDNAFFSSAAAAARASAATVRARLALPPRFLLYVGRLSPEKNLSRLLDAWSAVKSEDCTLLLVGGGPDEEKLRRQASGLKDVCFAGFLQQEDVAAAYGLADALILPSTSEPWGLVVNEAMAAGLPVLVSTSCGCTQDLVFPGVNGWLFAPNDSAQMTNAIQELISDRARRERMGQQSSAIIAPWSLQRWAAALTDCIACVTRPS